MIYLYGGPSHLDMYDLKPDAPAEFRGEFKPIRTNVPGMDICELMPLQARIADKLAIIRNLRFQRNQAGSDDHYSSGTVQRLSPGGLSASPGLRGRAAASDAGVRSDIPAFVLLSHRNRAPGIHIRFTISRRSWALLTSPSLRRSRKT